MLKSLSNKHISPACWAFIKIRGFDVITSDELRPVIVVDSVLSKYDLYICMTDDSQSCSVHSHSCSSLLCALLDARGREAASNDSATAAFWGTAPQCKIRFSLY